MQFLAQVLPERLEALQSQNYPVEAIICRDQVICWNIEIVSDLREILLHLFNNSLDHGYVLAFGQQAQKRPIRVELSAQLQADFVEITLQDFGAGINKDKLIAKAQAKNLEFDPQKPFDLIFADGVSTAQKATLTSGRGVGLAAVKSLIHDLGGVIEVQSYEQMGTKFIIHIPRSLALNSNQFWQKVS